MNWKELVAQVGEAEARSYLARRLREAADLVESEGYPDVLNCEVPVHEGALAGWGSDEIIERVSVTLSQPWPG